MTKDTQLKSLLIEKGWSEAIELLNDVIKHNPSGFARWVNTKCTIFLRSMCEPFRSRSYYRGQTRPLPFENDVSALDACIGKLSNNK